MSSGKNGAKNDWFLNGAARAEKMWKMVSEHHVFLHVVLSKRYKYQCVCLVCFGSSKSYKWRTRLYLRNIMSSLSKNHCKTLCFLRILLSLMLQKHRKYQRFSSKGTKMLINTSFLEVFDIKYFTGSNNDSNDNNHNHNHNHNHNNNNNKKKNNICLCVLHCVCLRPWSGRTLPQSGINSNGMNQIKRLLSGHRCYNVWHGESNRFQKKLHMDLSVWTSLYWSNIGVLCWNIRDFVQAKLPHTTAFMLLFFPLCLVLKTSRALDKGSKGLPFKWFNFRFHWALSYPKVYLRYVSTYTTKYKITWIC